MENYLDTGGVLPSGLLSGNDTAERIAGFNKTYKNYPLRLGVITQIFSASDPNNYSKLSTEYNVSVFEQNEDRGSTILTYKNCIASDSLGSIADFLDVNYRNLTVNTNPVGSLNSVNQNGATVLLLCLDGVSEKAVIIGGLNHPNRATTLTNSSPYLEGEYNGANIVVNTDGSTVFTFKGATDNYGNPTNPSQGNTVMQVKSDGSFQFNHSSITIQANRSGVLNITTTSDANITVGGNTNITTAGLANIIAQGVTTVDGSIIKLGVTAIESVIKGDTFRNLYNAHTHIGNLGIETSEPLVIMDPSLSKHVFTL